MVALTGPQVERPRYYRTISGASISNMISENIIEREVARFISGNVLTGTKISDDGCIGFYDSQVTVISEGNQQEFLGWISPGLQKFSMSKSYFSWLTPSKKFNLNTNYNGEERAYVVTGQYEKVLPMDIFPMQLVKACMIEDIDAMEQLVFMKCLQKIWHFANLSVPQKMEVQNIIREGLRFSKKRM